MPLRTFFNVRKGVSGRATKIRTFFAASLRGKEVSLCTASFMSLPTSKTKGRVAQRSEYHINLCHGKEVMLGFTVMPHYSMTIPDIALCSALLFHLRSCFEAKSCMVTVLLNKFIYGSGT